MEEDTATLIRRTFGEIELRRPLDGHDSVIDTTAADRLLGQRAERSWRTYPVAA
jgi:hypothetical protein